MKALLYTFAAVVLVAANLPAQPAAPDLTLTCDHTGWRTNNQETFCKLLDFTVPFAGSLAVNSGNGAVTVRGWDGADLIVRAQVQTSGQTLFDAEMLAARIVVEVNSSKVQATLPQSTCCENWSVSYEILVPHAADLAINIGNGALSLSDLQGHIQFNIGNGAGSLVRLAGNVEGKIGNGASAITLGGDHWEGQGLDVKIGNGAISIGAVTVAMVASLVLSGPEAASSYAGDDSSLARSVQAMHRPGFVAIVQIAGKSADEVAAHHKRLPARWQCC